MKPLFIIRLIPLIIILLGSLTSEAKSVEGYVFDKTDTKSPLVGVNIFWLGSTIGTITDANGYFKILQTDSDEILIFRYIGYHPDSVPVLNQSTLTIYLEPGAELDEVTVSDRVRSTNISTISPIFVQNITNKELTRFACCNLSESFETNASVDVAYADAVSGIKQIKLLGLSGRYSQLMMENIPMLRGAETAFGLEYIPGTWLQSIQVSKGTAAVKNGYESVTGQINVQFKEPEGIEKMSFYAYGNQDGKTESNFTYSLPLNDQWSTSFLIHGGTDFRKLDMNMDHFLDKPLTNQLNFMNRWNYKSKNKNTTVKIGISLVDETRNGGQKHYDTDKRQAEQDTAYGIGIDVVRLNGFVKIGHIFGRPATSLGWINSGNRFQRNSFYGLNSYDVIQQNFYSNLIFQSYVFNTKHTFNTGLSVAYDNNDELYNSNQVGYREFTPGAFLEYNYIPSEHLSVLVGMRYDHSSLHGNLITPRLHAKYHFPAYSTLRVTAGKGYRTASGISENTQYLASSRQLDFSKNTYKEEAWNYGISLVNEIPIGPRNLNLTLEYYRTDFVNQLVVDLENPRYVFLYNLNGKSYSNSAQIEAFYEPFKRFELTAAWRLNEVKTTYGGELKDVPLVGKYKGLLTAQYRTNLDKWQFDVTLQFHGQERIPSTLGNATENMRPESSTNYSTVLAQVTKNYRNWSFYVGGENLNNFAQKNAIIDPENPFGNEFDASQIWGPLYGRMFYVGVKYSIDRR